MPYKATHKRIPPMQSCTDCPRLFRSWRTGRCPRCAKALGSTSELIARAQGPDGIRAYLARRREQDAKQP